MRDGAGAPEVVAHAESCLVCTREVARLRQMRDALRGLPDEAAPPEVWTRLRAARARQRNAWTRWTALALAASVVMAVALMQMRPAELQLVEPVLPDRLAQLEHLLASLDTGRVVDMQTADTIVVLEDHIAAVDGTLRRATLDAPEAEALWRQRNDLMRALVGVHATGHPNTF